jgi:hypothetical protein
MGHSKHTLEYTLPVFPSERRKLVEELTQQEIIMKIFGPKDYENGEGDEDYEYELYRQRQLEMEQEAYEQHLGDR